MQSRRRSLAVKEDLDQDFKDENDEEVTEEDTDENSSTYLESRSSSPSVMYLEDDNKGILAKIECTICIIIYFIYSKTTCTKNVAIALYHLIYIYLSLPHYRIKVIFIIRISFQILSRLLV